MHWFINCIKFNYVNFEGRAQRQEFWMFFLFQALITIGCELLGNLISESLGDILSNIAYILLFLPWLAVNVRRLHDTDRSGWWILINLIPLIGNIVYLVFLCLNSTPCTNNYGENPKKLQERDI